MKAVKETPKPLAVRAEVAKVPHLIVLSCKCGINYTLCCGLARVRVESDKIVPQKSLYQSLARAWVETVEMARPTNNAVWSLPKSNMYLSLIGSTCIRPSFFKCADLMVKNIFRAQKANFPVWPVCMQIILTQIFCARRKYSGSDPKNNYAVHIRSGVHRAQVQNFSKMIVY